MQDKMPPQKGSCPQCKSTISTMTSSYIQYTEDPFGFTENKINHIHDSNLRTTMWKCQNDHEYESNGTVPCVGSILERNITRQTTLISRLTNNRPSQPINHNNYI